MDKTATNLMFSSNTDQWATPQEFFDRLNGEFNFTLDPCSDESNHKTENFFTKEQNGLQQKWGGNSVFMNPPYGRGITDKWIQKAYEESKSPNTTVVALIPSRTDTKFWHEYCMKAKEIRLVKGRLKFGDGSNSAPFPSAVVVFEGENRTPVLSAYSNK